MIIACAYHIFFIFLNLLLFVLNEDKSIDLKEEQAQNISLILVTLFVLNEDKSIDYKEEQSWNISLILVTLFVLNEDKSIDCK